MPKFDDRFFEDKRLTALRQNEEESLLKSLANQYGHRYINLHGVTINPEALLVIDETVAREARVVAFETLNKKLSVAIRNPNNPATKSLLDTLAKEWDLTIYMCSNQSLEHAYKRYADQKQTTAVKKGVLDIDPEEIVRLRGVLTDREKIKEQLVNIRTLNTARRISATLEVLFAGAMALGASDIHIEPEETAVRIRYRLDGVLHDVIELEQKVYERLVSRIKLLAGVKLNVRDEAQDGRFTFDVIEKEIEVRTSVIPGAIGESVVMRLLDPTVASFNMDELGINDIMYRVMEEELKRPNGMIITTGPTGSGKTTALYAFCDELISPK
ncbi:MAG: ATPase, T2SS/T4P/T4SS family [Candidatus Paceibacterota bacterium]